jgi:mannose-6-phosphate isomerase-like protein (cupin superfamily)
MVAWRTARLPIEPDAMSPGGVSEIRHSIRHDYGDLTHVRVPAGRVSAPAWLDVAEFFYVWAGWGQLWRKRGVGEDVVDLRPGTCASVLPGTAFQYRAQGGPTGSPTDLVIILAVVPHWSLELYHHADVDPQWVPTQLNGPLDPPPAAVGAELGPVIQLPANWDALAPDGSEIRSLPAIEAAGLAHCQLAPGVTSTAIRHRTVSETWFVLDGAGELLRSAEREDGLQSEITPLAHGVGVDIPLGTTFQFRSTGKDSLQLLLLTAPRWPGPNEAVVAEQQWSQDR